MKKRQFKHEHKDIKKKHLKGHIHTHKKTKNSSQKKKKKKISFICSSNFEEN